MSLPRTCTACGLKPVATNRHQHCYGCIPTGPQPEPPCRRCGSTTSYYSAGLCRRCHHFAPQVLDSCRDCHGWAVTRAYRFRCEGCRGWLRNFPEQGDCASCRRQINLNALGWCRLCWRQAAAARTQQRAITVLEANRHGQQLFLVDTFRQKRLPRSSAPSPQAALSDRRIAHHQLRLFEVPRDLRDIQKHPLQGPDGGTLPAQLDELARGFAASHGWSKTHRNAALRGLRVLLALQDGPAAAIRASDVTILGYLGLRAQPVMEILSAAGLLIDDRRPAVLNWFERQIADLPEPMTSEVRTWFETLHQGRTSPPRSRPRAEMTVRIRIRSARPAMQAWAAQGHLSLREITRADVLAVLPVAGSDRALMGTALRSLFSVLKRNRLVFTNPTTRLRTGRPEMRQPLPLELEPVLEAINSTRPERAALAVLTAFHAMRSGQLRDMHLTDLRDGRLHLPDRQIPLAPIVRDRISAWLDHRAQRWPGTVNPHLFINTQTAVRTTAVSPQWINTVLGISPHAVREDRILDEAIASGGDIRRLCDLFGLSITGAQRYVSVLGDPIQPVPTQ